MSAENLENIVRNSPDFVAVDRDLTITYLKNQSVSNLNPQDMFGTNLLDGIRPEFHEVVSRAQ